MPPRLVTLSTDIGWAYAAQMKAVLYRRLAPGRVVDLTHELPAHQILPSAYLLRAMAREFPSGTVHVAIVDPGVGGARAPVAVACREGSFLVGPDNGLLWLLAEELGVREVRRIRPHRAPREGATFDGRDLFAPAAAQLAAGEPFEGVGAPCGLTRLSVPAPTRSGPVLDGQVVWVDPFGNLITNLPSAWLPSGVRTARLRARTGEVGLTVARVYEGLPRDALGVLPSSFGLLEVSVRERSAAAQTALSTGDAVRVSLGAGRGKSSERRESLQERK
jgi:S-adenosyl-L-methionine hydrolase (adenosine-forming)